jgi:hypothetical protein
VKNYHVPISPAERVARYEELLEPLSPDQLRQIYVGLVQNGQLLAGTLQEITAETLAEACKSVDHVELVLSVSDSEDAAMLEQLMSRQIIRGPVGVDRQASPHRRPNGSWSTSRSSAGRSAGIAGAPSAPRQPRGPAPPDNRVLATVAPNPKKAGSKAHSVYACYVQGQTVREFVDAVKASGKSEKEAMDNLKYDMSRGFVTLATEERTDAAQS